MEEPSVMPTRKTPQLLKLMTAAWLGGAAGLCAMQVTGYQPQAHDRFASGFPAAPVRNTHPDFAGGDFDWTGVAWNVDEPRQGFGFLSPRHHILARHYPATSQRVVHGADGVLHLVPHQATVNLGLGLVGTDLPPDLSVARLATAVPWPAQLPRYPVLDLNAGSTVNSPSNYLNRRIFLCGHGGSAAVSTRVAETTVSGVTVSGNDHSFTTPRTAIQLELYDSGSPAFLIWTDPDGNSEPAITGNHVAIDSVSNYHNFTGSHEVMAAINGVMTPDGFALRVVGEPAHTWVGVLDYGISALDSWGISAPDPVPDDVFVAFNGATAGSGREVVVNASHNLRGLFFRNTGSDALGMTFTGSATLTIGRGGIHNRDASQQVFNAPLALGDHQYWDAGSGGVSVGHVDTQGRLLNIRSAGPSVIGGAVSGSGGIALEGGRLDLPADSTYTGKTWIHHGTLRVDGDIRTSERVVAGPGSVLGGHGSLPAVESAGAVKPAGILTAASLSPGAAMRMDFRVAAAAPDYADAAGTPNDVLRLTAGTPLSAALGAGNVLAFYFDEMPPAAATTFDGGIFFDNPATPQSHVANATVELHVADPHGDTEHMGATYSRLMRGASITLAPVSANFADGDVDGAVVRLALGPGSYGEWAAAAFPESTPEADRAPDAIPFHDGVSNLLSYALALDPLAPKSHLMPASTPGDGTLLFHFRRNLHAHDISVVVESSDDLADWTVETAVPVVSDPDVDGDGSAAMMAMEITTSPGASRKFARLRVEFDG